jgi:hypothetical protein
MQQEIKHLRIFVVLFFRPFDLHSARNNGLCRKSAEVEKSRPSVLSTNGETGMACINRRGDYWRPEIRRKGYKPTYRTFDTQKQGQLWARRVESEMESGLYVDRAEAERTTLHEALEPYKRDILPTKRHRIANLNAIADYLNNTNLTEQHIAGALDPADLQNPIKPP